MRGLQELKHAGPATTALTVLRDVVHKQCANSAAVVSAGDGAVSLLPCRVPDLGLDGLTIHLHDMKDRIDAAVLSKVVTATLL